MDFFSESHIVIRMGPVCNNSHFCDAMIKKITGNSGVLQKNYVQNVQNVI